MDLLWAKLADAVISQTGLTGGALVAIIAYLGWSLARERSRNEADRQQARKEADERADAFRALAEANHAISITLAEMKGILTSMARK